MEVFFMRKKKQVENKDSKHGWLDCLLDVADLILSIVIEIIDFD
jgi:hypothetical protein